MKTSINYDIKLEYTNQVQYLLVCMLIFFIVYKFKLDNLILFYIIKYFLNYDQVNGAISV